MRLNLLTVLALICASSVPAFAEELIQPGDYRPSLVLFDRDLALCGRHIEVVIPGKKYVVEYTTRNSSGAPGRLCKAEGQTRFVECSIVNGETQCTHGSYEIWIPLPDGNIAVQGVGEAHSFKMYKVNPEPASE